MTFPFFGGLPERGGFRFRTMAAAPRRVDLVLQSGRAAGIYELSRASDSTCEVWVEQAAPGDRYGFRLDEAVLRPDPASRFQPEGVHGPSEIIDPNRFVWHDGAWQGRTARELILYELHIGAFTPEGTFDAARQRLPLLRDLGVTAIEIMPVADFPGDRNWGYDGVCLFAPSRAYGRPDDLRRLVDDAHALGLGVILDVVYNHLGPEGSYLTEFYPPYITKQHSTPWGGAVNLDGPGSEIVRRFIVDNAVHWVREYHLDGLRLDATHALIDTSHAHLIAEVADEVRRAARWPVAIHAEDHRNLSTIVEPRDAGGFGMDAVWADDFHHVARRMLAGDEHGYFGDFEGTAEELARTIRHGWLYTGQASKRTKRRRGTDASHLPMQRSIVCLQNHDQVGNRAMGDRLHHQIDLASWRAASAVLLTAPMIPLLFMGQEWGATSPFLFFSDLAPEFGRAVAEGRRREFSDFPEFAEGGSTTIPDPQSRCAFASSKLVWEERARAPHSSLLALYTRLLALRAAHPALQASEDPAGEAWAPNETSIVVRRSGAMETFLIVACLRGEGPVDHRCHAQPGLDFEVVLTTEEEPFASDPLPPEISSSSVNFRRAGAVVFRLNPEPADL